MPNSICEDCGVKIDNSCEVCAECCDHSDICTDERGCLICGKDMTETLSAYAEYVADMQEDR